MLPAKEKCQSISTPYFAIDCPTHQVQQSRRASPMTASMSDLTPQIEADIKNEIHSSQFELQTDISH